MSLESDEPQLNNTGASASDDRVTRALVEQRFEQLIADQIDLLADGFDAHEQVAQLLIEKAEVYTNDTDSDRGGDAGDE